MINLLQIVDTTTKVVQAASTADANGDGKISLGELLTMGGLIMIPLILLFLLTIFFFFERVMAIRRASRIDSNFMNIIRDHIVNGNVTAARSFAIRCCTDWSKH